MSWIDKIQNALVITTGEGSKYSPSWLNAVFVQEYNVSDFEFANVEGTLVKRKLPLGRKYNLELYFQGEDHLDISEQFRLSANDSRPWVMEHPLYGRINVQPISLSFDNSGLNVTKITGSVMETILEDNPKVTVRPVDAIAIQTELVQQLFSDALTAPCDVTDQETMLEVNTFNFNLALPTLKLPKQIKAFMDAFHKANAAINNLTHAASKAMATVMSVINAPAMFANSVKGRLNLLKGQFNTLRATVNNLTHPGSKQIYQNMGGGILSTMCLASSLPLPGDYNNTTKCLEAINDLQTVHDSYMADIDLLQSVNGGNPNSFIPNPDAQIALSQLMGITISNLFTIAFNNKSERILIVESDTNWIVLTHRVYGLDPSDANIQELMDENKAGLNDVLQVRKGTRVRYYV